MGKKWRCEMLTFVQPQVREQLIRAGWYPEREVSLPPRLIQVGLSTHPGAGILAALAGLHAGAAGPGRECPTSDIKFCWLDDGFDGYIGLWEKLLKTTLVGVGEFDDGNGALYVAEDGRCFGLCLISEQFYFSGQHLEDALERFIVGLRLTPMLEPDEPQVTAYGITYTHDSAEIYKY
jgi:hypothetical protein